MAEIDGSPDSYQGVLESMAKSSNVPHDVIKLTYYDKVDKYKDSELEDDETPQSKALGETLGKVREWGGDNIEKQRFGGNIECIPILALGYRGPIEVDNSRMMLGYGVVNPINNQHIRGDEGITSSPLGRKMNNLSGVSDTAGLSVFKFNEGDIDFHHVKYCFQPLNTLRGKFVRERAEAVSTKGNRPTYILKSLSNTNLKKADIIELPSSLKEKRNGINRVYLDDNRDVFTLDTASQYISQSTNGHPDDYGLDIKRIRGYVVDVYRDFGDPNDAEYPPFGIYTIRDNSMTTQEIINSELHNESLNMTNGLHVWLPPEIMEYNVDSYVDIYGTLKYDNDNYLVMEGCSVLPISAIK